MRTGLQHWHSVCAGCGYEASALEPGINDLAAHGQLDERQREAGLKATRVESFRQIVELIELHRGGRGGSLLDVGSAHGWFLEQARRVFEVQGIEPDDQVRAEALKRGLPVRGGYFPFALDKTETFDVVIFNDVIEHIPDIRAALRACHERLNEDGLLVLNLPNSGGLFYRLSALLARCGWKAPFSRLWQQGLPSPHVHYFNSGNLTALVERHGFILTARTQIAAVRARGLWQRLACDRNTRGAGLYLQYAGVLCAVPLLRLFQSDIIVCVFRRAAALEAATPVGQRADQAAVA